MNKAAFILNLVTFLVLIPIAVGNGLAYQRNVELAKHLQALQQRVYKIEIEMQEKRNTQMQRPQ